MSSSLVLLDSNHSSREVLGLTFSAKGFKFKAVSNYDAFLSVNHTSDSGIILADFFF